MGTINLIHHKIMTSSICFQHALLQSDQQNITPPRSKVRSVTSPKTPLGTPRMPWCWWWRLGRWPGGKRIPWTSQWPPSWPRNCSPLGQKSRWAPEKKQTWSDWWCCAIEEYRAIVFFFCGTNWNFWPISSFSCHRKLFLDVFGWCQCFLILRVQTTGEQVRWVETLSQFLFLMFV